ncbi:ATP-binding cassette domain-containing protein [Streptosporangium jomthongense]|uniref:ATP-binding cassette domain-containing protein n=1 Tax=Streptosporangium jomthongense TaxID=1193683 RepID=A0ABV8EUP0_9ACTN
MPGPSLTRPRPGRDIPPSGAAPAQAPPYDGRLTGDGGLRLLVSLLRPRPRPLAVAALWSVVEALPTLLSGLLIATAVDRGFLAGSPGTGLAWLGLLGLTMLVQAAAVRMMFPALAAVVEPLRDDLVAAVVTAAVTRAAKSARPPDAAAVTRLTEQVETVRNLVSALLRSTRALGVSLVAALGGLLLLSPLLAAVVAVPVTVALVVFARLLRVLVARQRALILADEELTGQATPILAGLRDVAACGARWQAYATVRAAVDTQVAATHALAWAGLSRRLVVALGAHLPLFALLIAARPLIGDGHLSAGEVVGAVTYLATGLDPALRALTGVVGGWGVTLAVTLRRLGETIAPPPEPSASTPVPPAPYGTAPQPGPSVPAPVPPSPYGIALAAVADVEPVGHGLRLENVGFAYAPEATPVVRHLDLTIAEGEHLAVVGPSGIGKSTLSMLLTGIRRPTEGRILLGGLPIEAVPEHRLRSLMALVPQEAYVFTGTVAENLAYLRPEGTRVAGERLEAAAEAVGAGALVERLGGLRATIEEPAALSAGERQLIALARVHASPARIVVLDEATCHLDPAAEQRAEAAFAARGGTLVVIAHRMSSAGRAGRVLLMDGTAALTGSHRELTARSPLYADLVGHWHGGDPSGHRPPEGSR